MARIWRRKRWLWGSVAVVGALAIVAVLVDLFRLTVPIGQTPEAQLNPERVRVMEPKLVAKLMNLKAGDAVLDIGAGFGLYTFPFAQAVGDAGRVYATDVDPNVIRYLTEQAQQSGLVSVVPVRVRRGGDPFYKEHTFDAILVADVILHLGPGIPDFLYELRSSLKRSGGRLWVVHPRFAPDFDAAEFGDFSIVLDVFKSHGLDSPVIKRFSTNVINALVSRQGRSIPKLLQPVIVEDLNHMLDDPTLWPDVQRQLPPEDAFFRPRLRQSIKYLQSEIDKEGGATSEEENVKGAARPLVRLLNRFIIQEVFSTEEWEKVFLLDKAPGKMRRESIRMLRQHPPVAILTRVGYKLVREYDMLIYHHLWEFERAF